MTWQFSSREASVKELFDLGLANDWHDTPDIVKKCRELEHAELGLTESQADTKQFTSVYICRACGYIYRIEL